MNFLAILRLNLETNDDFSSDSENDYQPSCSSSSSDTNSSSESCNDISMKEDEMPKKRPITIVAKTPNTRSRNRQDLVLQSDSYFSHHSSKKVRNS